jgi:hypothetical protein
MVVVLAGEVRVRVRVVVVVVARVRVIAVIVLVARVAVPHRRRRDLAGAIDGVAVALRRRAFLAVGTGGEHEDEGEQRDALHGFFFG